MPGELANVSWHLRPLVLHARLSCSEKNHNASHQEGDAGRGAVA
jgi:hypothetical protein